MSPTAKELAYWHGFESDWFEKVEHYIITAQHYSLYQLEISAGLIRHVCLSPIFE